MFHLKNQLISILLIAIFSSLILALDGKNSNNLDEDAKKDINSLNDLYGQTIDQANDQLDSDGFLTNVAMIKKSNLNIDDQLNSLNNIDWKPVEWPLEIDTSSVELQPDSSETESIKKTAKKSNLNYVTRVAQPKRTIYRPIRAQKRCLKRGSLCEPGNNPIINCCSHSVCRCNFFSDQCRCDRMSLLQRWGR